MAVPNEVPQTGRPFRVATLLDRLSFRARGAVQSGQNVSLQAVSAYFTYEAGPYALNVSAFLTVSGANNGDDVTFEALCGWTHADGSGQGYEQAWQVFKARAGDGGAAGSFRVLTGAQFNDPPGTQFLAQMLVRGVAVNGNALPDQVATQPVPVSIPQSPDQAGYGGAGSTSAPPPTYAPGVGYQQPSAPPPTFQPPAGPPQGNPGPGGGWYPGSLIVQLVQGLFGQGSGG